MASARGDALDWALALARAPGERRALRQRPLPDGMETVLQVAGGSHVVAIQEAAAHAGMAPAEVVEAARFYLREMLFFPDADAYRVLGLAADASDEQVKHHHRLLQQWLHPDRPTSDWDAAFAARVNAAWSQLRTPARREAYAATLPATPPVADSAPSWSPPTRIRAPRLDGEHAEAALDEDRWRRRAPVLALFGVCALLGVLAVRDMQQEPERALAGGEPAAMPATEDAPEVALQLPAATPPAVAKPAAQKRVDMATVRPARSAPVAAKPATKPAPTPTVRTAVAVVDKPVKRPVLPPVAMAAAPKPKAVPDKRTLVLAKAPASKPAVVLASAAPKAVATPVPAKPAAKTAVAAIPPPVKPPSKTAAVAAPKAPSMPVVVAAKPVARPATRPATVAPPPEPKAIVAAVPVAPEAPVAAPPRVAQSPVQVAQAQQTGQRLLAYVSGRGGGVPPIWANVASQTQASRARDALQGAGRVDVGTPNWRVGENSAAMQASLTPRDGGARRLRVDMVWREQRWLVTGLVLEQAP